jgi:hypothetical protein
LNLIKSTYICAALCSCRHAKISDFGGLRISEFRVRDIQPVVICTCERYIGNVSVAETAMGRQMNAQDNSESEYVKAVYEWVFATSLYLDAWITISRCKRRGFSLYVLGLFVISKNADCLSLEITKIALLLNHYPITCIWCKQTSRVEWLGLRPNWKCCPAAKRLEMESYISAICLTSRSRLRETAFYPACMSSWIRA